MDSVTLWLLRHPQWEKPVLLGCFLGSALLYAGLCYGAWCHNQRVEADCVRSRCPQGLTGKYVEGTGCLCVTVPLP